MAGEHEIGNHDQRDDNNATDDPPGGSVAAAVIAGLSRIIGAIGVVAVGHRHSGAPLLCVSGGKNAVVPKSFLKMQFENAVGIATILPNMWQVAFEGREAKPRRRARPASPVASRRTPAQNRRNRGITPMNYPNESPMNRS
jgi:hypothetical protein